MSSSSRKSERVLGSFTSLLSCAMARSREDQSMRPISGSSSTLPRLISRSVSNDQVCCMIPTLMLKHPDSPHQSASLEEQAALNLARNLALTREELEAGPAALLGNLSLSFSELINSRLRSALSALIRTSKTAADPTLQRVIVGLLSVSNNPVSQTTIVSSFRVISAADVSLNGDIVMPLVMEGTIDLKVLNELVTVNMVAPGTIQGSFGRRGDLGIVKCEVTLDTVSFLTLLMKEARLVVRRALAIASQFATNLLVSPHSSGIVKHHQPTALLPTKHQSMPVVVNSGPTKLEMPVPKRESGNPDVVQSSGEGKDQGEEKDGDPQEKAPQLMPPPPSRPHKPDKSTEEAKGDSCRDNEHGSRKDDKTKRTDHTSSGTKRVPSQAGLSLLAQALSTLNKGNGDDFGSTSTDNLRQSNKRMRTES